MAGLSEIEWTDATWNPISGCAMISPGCTNCYAMRMAARLQAMNHPAYAQTTRKSGGGRPVWSGKLHLNEKALTIPARLAEASKDICQFNVGPFPRWRPDKLCRASLGHNGTSSLAHVSDFDQAPRQHVGKSEGTFTSSAPKCLAGHVGRVGEICGPNRTTASSSRIRAIHLIRASDWSNWARESGWHSLGDCRRRVRPQGSTDERGLGGGNSQPVQRSTGHILF
jgi:Protein of unknown function (DUF5131)